jgi:DMSO/TMAO reductase YedYZ molybdopterin-dependent catalytic subunit
MTRPTRRQFLQYSAAVASAAALSPRLSFGDGPAEYVRFPEKTDLLLLTDRPPNLETPLKYFSEDLTPNDAFFVRWHLATIPTSIDTAQFRLAVRGHVDQPLALSLDDLRKQFEAVSLIAVNQCSGNSRSLFNPRVPGGQWGNGAMGNAKWTGVRVRDLLGRAKPKAAAVELAFGGLDRAPLPTVQNFVKSLAFDHATDGEVMIAYEMNGQPLPMLNGFPLRLIVPGWYGTYWIKALNDIEVLNKPFDGFWMAKAYRVPKDEPNCNESPKDLAKETVPISRMTVRSLFVSPESGEKIGTGREVEISGLAMDSGQGIKTVEVSADAGKSWSTAALDADLGKYSWRRWRFKWKPSAAGQFRLMCRATNAAGQTQTTQQWNRSGYARNVIESVDVTVG